MAKLEIPSIVVQSGSHTPPAMDHSTARTQWSLSTQSTYEEDCDLPTTEPVREEEKTEIPPTPPPTNNNTLTRSRSKANLKLLKRSHAIKESTSPPPDISLLPVTSPSSPTSAELPATPTTPNNNNNSATVNNNSSNNLRPVNKREGSNMLSRGNSLEQQYEPYGSNIEVFLHDTMNKNAKDRMLLLKIESDLIAMVRDPRKHTHKFGAMSSYQRMLVHRAASYFGMDHNVDTTGQSVVVNKGRFTRMPRNRFSDLINDEILLSEEPRRSILKRDSASFEESGSFKSPDRHLADPPRRSKSFEEREEEYEKARRRIFHQEQGDMGSQQSKDQEEENLHWNGPIWTSSEDSSKLQPPFNHRLSRLTKVESYECKDTLKANSLRSSISKSYSFGGYDQPATNSRVLTKQDSGSSVSSRVSPSTTSSGYKSQSQRSDATMSATPSPTATPHLTTQLSNQSEPSPEPEQSTVMWAVTNMDSVPNGAVIINPQTGRPFTNEDGSVYRFDPNNPLPHMNKTERYSSEPEIMDSSSPTGHLENNQMQSEPPTDCDQSNPCVMDSTNHSGDLNQHQTMEIPSHSQFHPVPPPPPAVLPLPPQINLPHHNQVPVTYTQPPTVYHNPYIVMQPPTTDGEYCVSHVNPSRPMVYEPPTQSFGPTYEHRLSYMEELDACNYMMNLSIRDGPRTDTGVRTVYYGTSAPAAPPPGPPPPPQGPSNHHQVTGMPLFFTSAPSSAQPQGPSQPPRYQLYSYTQIPQTEQTGQECSYAPGQINGYYQRCPAGSQLTAPIYPTTSAGPASMMGFVPLAQPSHTRPYHRMATPPATPQNGCPQYPQMFSSAYAAVPNCYPPYQGSQFNPQLPINQILRPGVQLNMANSPPLRANRLPYNAARSPLDPVSSDVQSHTSSLRFSAAQTPLPLIRLTYPGAPTGNECVLLNPGGRPPFVMPPITPRSAAPAINTYRRHRPRPGGSRSVLTLGAASQQQAALATAIEAAGLAGGNFCGGCG